MQTIRIRSFFDGLVMITLRHISIAIAFCLVAAAVSSDAQGSLLTQITDADTAEFETASSSNQSPSPTDRNDERRSEDPAKQVLDFLMPGSQSMADAGGTVSQSAGTSSAIAISDGACVVDEDHLVNWIFELHNLRAKESPRTYPFRPPRNHV